MSESSPQISVEAEKPVRKRVAKAAPEAPKEAEGPRQWAEVVTQIRDLREKGVTVPEIADTLELPYVLVNQVMLQSYKMTVDTIGMFQRHEERRLGQGA